MSLQNFLILWKTSRNYTAIAQNFPKTIDEKSGDFAVYNK
jgi:hypothetical protein